ncbi:hypothetical protein [Pseudoxanthomonas composti]|uniref:Uncharacterized protein n=1 Tax=Pseudoxanthomonas composti TaxID=2137479 RepID=A0A4Q1JY55_9GAMM|nr:hypothetical protein [Pseudoxanthomonas composti]RXR08290.1 hypothetical protein EPA99_00185 [Pseudoxanthomonas composti]
MTTRPMILSQPRHPRHRAHLAAVLATALAAGMLPPAAPAQEKPATQPATASRAALLAEVARALKSRNIAAPNVERIVANLSQLDMSELEALAGFGGTAATGAGRLVEGASGSVRDRAGELTGRVGGSAGGGTSASQRGVERAMRPGMRDTRGQLSTCQACPEDASFMGNTQRNGAGMAKDNSNSASDQPRRIDAGNRDVIKIYKDGSASIIRMSSGRIEYVNSDQRLVDESGNAKEPAPDSEQGSGGFTAADVKRVGALINQHRQPTGDESGNGGPVDTGRTDPTGARGLYTESRLGAGYVSEGDLREIVRLSIEKLRGPQGR